MAQKSHFPLGRIKIQNQIYPVYVRKIEQIK